MLMVPELNAMPGRHAYDQTEFLSSEEILERCPMVAEAAVLSTCDRYCVFVAAEGSAEAAVAGVERAVTREIAVRAGTLRCWKLSAGLDVDSPTSVERRHSCLGVRRSVRPVVTSTPRRASRDGRDTRLS